MLKGNLYFNLLIVIIRNMKKEVLLIGLLMNIFFATAQFNISEWKATYQPIAIQEKLGREALYCKGGLVYMPSSFFSNGVIEVDILTQVMGGLAFRIDSNFNYEDVYLRVPKSGAPDALQYGAVFNAEFSWQFYQEYQANVIYPKNEWIHMKIIVENDQAGVFINNSSTPVLLIDSLRTGNKNGCIGFWSLADAWFANLQIRSAAENEKLPKIEKKIIRNEHAIREWLISKPMSYSIESGDLGITLSRQLKWESAITDPDGYLNINRYAKKNIAGRARNNSSDIVWLKYKWNETSAFDKPFSFEYSNICFIYFNGKKIFSGNNSFLLKGPLFRGDIDKKMRANTLFLPTRKGLNTLLVGVAGVVNGWGFMGQFVDGTKLAYNLQ